MIEDKYLELFIDEINEHIENLNKSLLELEQNYKNREIINEIFRVAHTLKSSAAFVGLSNLSQLAHKMEDLFQLIKDKKLNVDVNLINLLFLCLDSIKKVASNIQEKKDEDSVEIQNLIKKIEYYLSLPKKNLESFEEKTDNLETITEVTKVPYTEQKEELEASTLELTPEEKNHLKQIITHEDKVFIGFVSIDEEAPMKNLRLLLIYNKLAKFVKFFKVEPDIEILEKNSEIRIFEFIIYGKIDYNDLIRFCQIDLVENVQIKQIEIEKDKEIQKASELSSHIQTKKNLDKEVSDTILKTRNIKVSSEKIDYILNNVGELVITNSGLQKIYDDLQENFGESPLLNELKNKIEQAVRIARELQSGIMKMRMMPVGIVFQRFYRPVRDLSLSLNKKVELIVEGEETELDKNIIDSLNDPLMHLIRNAIDHGIELPEERIQKGKPETGKIYLKSYQSGNHIFIEVQDDGKGLDKEKILKKAISLGLVSENQSLSDQEIYQFIFQSGFSTSELVTNVSGRGVGMDVVRKIIEEFKGGVQIQTFPDKGTSFQLMFPLTLAIISTIHVKVQGEEYAFPLSDVVETIKVPLSQLTTLQGKNVINLRKEIVPIYELSVLMGLPSQLNHKNILTEKQDDLEQEEKEKELSIIITAVGAKKVGYIVDDMIGKKEIVVKSLQQNYKQIPGLMGACLLGDGSIVMILDVATLLDLAIKFNFKNEELQQKNIKIINTIKKYNQKVSEFTFQSKHKKKKSPIKLDKIEKREDAIITIEEQNLPQEKLIIKNHETTITQPDDLNLQILLENFKKDKERRKEIGLQIFEEQKINNNLDQPLFLKEDDHIDQILSEEEYKKLYSVINSGMVNAGLVLSQLLGVTIDVSVPEFKTIFFENLGELLDHSNYYAIFLETLGEFSSLLALVFDEITGINTAGELMGIPIEQRKKELMSTEDIQSVLNELTNIVGSSLLNEIANRTSLVIKPSVPEFHLLSKEELIHLIQNKKRPSLTEKIIYICTDFLRDESELLGKMFLLPSKPNLIELLKRIKI